MIKSLWKICGQTEDQTCDRLKTSRTAHLTDLAGLASIVADDLTYVSVYEIIALLLLWFARNKLDIDAWFDVDGRTDWWMDEQMNGNSLLIYIMLYWSSFDNEQCSISCIYSLKTQSTCICRVERVIILFCYFILFVIQVFIYRYLTFLLLLLFLFYISNFTTVIFDSSIIILPFYLFPFLFQYFTILTLSILYFYFNFIILTFTILIYLFILSLWYYILPF